MKNDPSLSRPEAYNLVKARLNSLKPDGLQTPRKNAAANEETHFQTEKKKRKRLHQNPDDTEMIDTSTQRIDNLDHTQADLTVFNFDDKKQNDPDKDDEID